MKQDSNNSILFICYNRPITGRENSAVSVIERLIKYLDGAKGGKLIDSYDAYSLAVHGGSLNGFVIIRGSREKLDALKSSDEFDNLAIEAHMTMTGVGVLTGVHGEAVTGRRLQRVNKLAKANFS